MAGRAPVVKYVGTTVAGIVTQNAQYEVIEWIAIGTSSSADVEILFLDDSGVLRHFNINSADWQVVRV